MVCCERAPPTGPIEQAPGEDGLVEFVLHERLVPLDIVLLLLGCEAELHVDLLGVPPSSVCWEPRGACCGEKDRSTAPFRPAGRTANSASVLRRATHRVAATQAIRHL